MLSLKLKQTPVISKGLMVKSTVDCVLQSTMNKKLAGALLPKPRAHN